MHHLAEAIFFVNFFNKSEYIDILSEFMTVKLKLYTLKYTKDTERNKD